MPGWAFGAHPGILSLLLSLLSRRSREMTLFPQGGPQGRQQHPVEGRVCVCAGGTHGETPGPRQVVRVCIHCPVLEQGWGQ